MGIRHEVLPFLLAAPPVGVAAGLCCRLLGGGAARCVWTGAVPAAVLGAYLLYFFRDPERTPPDDPRAVVAGADGVLARISRPGPRAELGGAEAVRLSIFLSLFDVHVNRAPLGGASTFLGYRPGKRFFTFLDKSSEMNQHNAILIEGESTRCLLHQIVGPVARRVVYWPDHGRAVKIARGERIGMMKFGSRLDMYLPAAAVVIVAREGDRVRAGETVVARVTNPAPPPAE